MRFVRRNLRGVLTMTEGHNGQFRAFVERIESVETEIRERQEDRKEIYSEAKGTGYDVAIMRKVVAIRRKDYKKWREEEIILDMYLTALGMA